MRILFLTKRHPQQRDLVEQPYGRFHHLPATLAALGHEVRVQLYSYRRSNPLKREFSGVHWSSDDLLALGIRGAWKKLTAETARFRPDWIIGCSDAWFGWLAHRLAHRSGARLAVDAYDNFEAYMSWNLPLHWKWRNAIRAADLVTSAGPQLAAHLQRYRSPGRGVEVVPMAADPRFKPMSREACRASLGLPQAAPLIGYSGSWASKRGTHVLVDSVARVRATRPDARLVLTGRPPRPVRESPEVTALGYLCDAQLPCMLNALDVACIITVDNPFGRFSYPAKLCEAMACGVAVVASGTEPVRWMLNNDTRFIAPVGSVEGISALILNNLSAGRVDYGPLPSWQECGKQLEGLLSVRLGR